jgi:glycosyltransferase involved in cell wall biosynthesis
MTSSSKGNIRILSQYFYPDVASTGQLLTELAVGLKKKGINVNVITAKPTYAGKLDAPKKEVYKSVGIRRLRAIRMDKNSKKGQIFNSVSFFVRAFFHILFSGSKIPLLIVSNPPFLPIMGYLMYKVRKINYIVLIHDVFPEKAIKLNYIKQNGVLTRLWKFWDKKSLKYASGVVVISETMKENLVNKFKLYRLDDTEKITVIHNWAAADFIKPLSPENNIFLREHDLQDKFIVQYSGNLGASYELEVLIHAANEINDEEILFLFIGDGVKKRKLIGLVERYNLNNVKFLPYQKKEMLPFSLTASSLSIVTYEREMEGLLMPSKLYTTLASGVAIISFCTRDSEVGTIINNAQCGLSIDPSNTGTLIEKILYLKNNPEVRFNMGKNARLYFENNFTLDHSLIKYANVINDVQNV